MAKLEELVTPMELLEVMRGGALKSQVIKKYRTSEQELAMMLLPLYRSGELSKEEFNDFFKGLPLRPKEAPPDRHPSVEDEPPSQIVKSLSDAVPEPLAAEVVRPERVPEAAPEEVEPPREAAPVVEEIAAEPLDETALVEEAEFVEEVEFGDAALEALEQAEVEEVEAEVGAVEEAVEEAIASSADVRNALDVIITKLTSIDNRLATIERNLKPS